MLTDVVNLLNLSTQQLGETCFIGVCEKGADSTFLVHHFISYFLKQNCNVVLISFSQSFNHFNGVGNKIGNSLTKAREQKQFLFIDGLKNLAQAVNLGSVTGENIWQACVNCRGELNISTLFEILTAEIDDFRMTSDKKTVIVVDNISALLHIGVSAKDTTLFIQYLSIYMNEKCEGNMVVGCENNLGKNDEEGHLIMNYVQHCADLSIEVKGLETGYCRDVHGQIVATWYKRMSREKPTTKTSQYKLTDKTCALFASGMSSAVL